MTGYEPIITNRDWNRATEADWAEVLAGLPLFSKLREAKRRRIARQSQFTEFAPGETVVVQGAPGDWFYVILGGEAKVVGKPGVLRTGDYFGEIALLDGGPRSATVVATNDLHVMRLPRQLFLAVVEQNPDVALTLLTGLGTRLRRVELASA
jgi:CRP-like cAMP-binding protein